MAVYLLLVVLQVLIPLAAIASMARGGGGSRRDWTLSFLLEATFLAFIFLATPWGFVPYWLRYLWPLLFAAAAVRSFRRVWGRRAEEPKSRVSVFWTVLPALFLGAQTADCIRGRFYPGPAVELEFPLREGVYLVGHGGSHRKVNYHVISRSQRYALDILALNGLGLRASGMDFRRLDRYAIWGHTLYSPADGTVRTVVNDLPDLTPPASDPKNPAGNHVEIEAADGVRIFLAHMQRGSVRVKPGERVRAGDPLGKVGNSGNTSEPHLHIHAVRGGKSLFDGEGVPLTFNGRFLVRNDLVFGRGGRETALPPTAGRAGGP